MRKFKGGGSSQPQEMTTYTTDLPEYVRPYFERLLQRGEAESLQGYTPYGGQRLAYFDPDELTSQAMARGFGQAGTPQEYLDASARYGAQQAYGPSGYTQGDVASGYTAGTMGPGYQAGTIGPGYQGAAYGSGYQAGAFDPGYTARKMGPGYQGATYESGYRGGTFDPGYTAETRASQYQAGAIDPLSYEENIQRFMSPYQQNVVDIEKREAKRQADIAAAELQDRASASGGLGGFREAIMQSEGQRNRAQLQADIQTRGSQAAYESAQRQLGAERQFGLQRYGAEQQAYQSQEQMAQSAFNAGQAAKQQAAQMGMTAQQQEEAARQAEEKFSQSAFSQTQQALQAKGTQAIQAYQAGEQARQQAAAMGMTAQQQEEAAKQAQEKFSQSAFAQTQQAMQAAGAQGIQSFQSQEAARQAQGAQAIQAYQAGEAARQQAAKLGLSAEQIEQAGKQAEEKFKQSAYDLSSRYGLAAAQGLMQTGQGIQQDALSRIQLLEQVGQRQRALRQAGLDMGYQDFLRQRDFTQRQLGLFGNLLRGVPVQPEQTISTFQQQPGLFQTGLGAGLTGLGMYRGLGSPGMGG
tara:strand:- start:1838 stop:3577 length:1740 start_codon:yes stop_codon:yes gene_type:complete